MITIVAWLMLAILVPTTAVVVVSAEPASALTNGDFTFVAGVVDGLGGNVQPEGLALSSDGSKIYVAIPAADKIRVVDLATNAVSEFADVDDPHRIAVGPDALYVTSGSSGYDGIAGADRPGAIGPDKVVRVGFDGSVTDWTTGFFSPKGIAFDAAGTLWVSDTGWTCTPWPGCDDDGGFPVTRVSHGIQGQRQVVHVFDKFDWNSGGSPFTFAADAMYVAVDNTSAQINRWVPQDPGVGTPTGMGGEDLVAVADGRGILTLGANYLRTHVRGYSTPIDQALFDWIDGGGLAALAISPDGRTAYVTASGGYATGPSIWKTDIPDLTSQLSADELNGGSNPSMPCLSCAFGRITSLVRAALPVGGDPVVLSTGNYYESATDIAIAGRGPALGVTRTYNSSRVNDNSLFGQGWWSNLDTSLEEDPQSGSVTIHQENASVVRFDHVGNDYMAATHVSARLARDGDTWTLTRGVNDIVRFDATGRVIAFRDANDYQLSISYPNANQIVETDASGRTLSFTLGSGHVSSVSDQIGRSVSYTYAGDDLVSVVGLKANPSDASGVTTAYAYDPTAHYLTNVTNGRGNTNTTHYDANGRVDYQLDFAAKRTDFAYSSTNPLTVDVTHPANNDSGIRPTTRYVFNQMLATSMTTAYGTAEAATWSYEYDPAVLGITKITGPGGVVEATTTYDENANITSVTDALGRVVHYEYDEDNHVVRAVDPAGVATTTTYDANGNVTSTCTPLGTLPQGGAVIDCNSPGVTQQVTLLTYDPAHPGEPVTFSDARTKTWSYARDSYGYVTSLTDPTGAVSTTVYDSVGRITSSVSPRGNAPGANPAQFTTTYLTNDFGSPVSTTDPLGNTTTSTLDAAGNVVSSTDADSNVTTTTYDAMNRPVVVTRPDGTTIGTQYYDDGSLRAQIDAAGAATTYTYDLAGRTTSSTDPNSRSTTYSYDNRGNLTAKTDAGGNCATNIDCTHYSYDTADRLVSIDYSDPQTADVSAITYDAVGRRSAMVDSSGSTTWSWDSLGRLVASADPTGGSVTYGWDIASNLTSIGYGPNKVVTRAYDDAGRFISTTDWAGRTTTFAYDENSNQTQTVYPSTVQNTDTFVYDRANRLTNASNPAITYKRGSVTLASLCVRVR